MRHGVLAGSPAWQSDFALHGPWHRRRLCHGPRRGPPPEQPSTAAFACEQQHARHNYHGLEDPSDVVWPEEGNPGAMCQVSAAGDPREWSRKMQVQTLCVAHPEPEHEYGGTNQ